MLLTFSVDTFSVVNDHSGGLELALNITLMSLMFSLT